MDEDAIRADERARILELIDKQIKSIYAEDSTASDMMKEWAKGMVLAYNIIAKETWDKPSEMVEY